MTTIPPSPFFNSSAALACSSDEAAAPGPQMPSAGAAADISDIGEIFAGARKLEPVEMWFENSAYPREDELLFEVLEAMVDQRLPGLAEMPYGMEWIFDPPPLFLRQVG